MDRNIKNVTAKDILNVACMSELLTGNYDYIRKSWMDQPHKIPKKYRKLILNLLEYVDAWLIEVEDIKRKHNDS